MIVEKINIYKKWTEDEINLLRSNEYTIKELSHKIKWVSYLKIVIYFNKYNIYKNHIEKL